MAEEWDQDFEDVMTVAPRTVKHERGSSVPEQVKTWCEKRGMSVRQCAEYHWQVTRNGEPIVDFWPSTRKYRFNKAAAGSRARAGGADQIIGDLKAWYAKHGATPLEVQGTESGRVVQVPHADVQGICQVIADTLRPVVNQLTAAVAELRVKQTMEVPNAKVESTIETFEPIPSVGSDPLDDFPDEDDDDNVARPERGDPPIVESVDYTVLYMVAMHALIIRAESLDDVSDQADRLAMEALNNGRIGLGQ